jgi:DNA-binding CsgD family transcriptional regulator
MKKIMDAKKGLEFTSTIYDAVLRPDSWDEVLDEFAVVVGAGGARLQVIDQIHEENKCVAMSTLFRSTPDFEKKFEHYFNEISQDEKTAYEYIYANPGIGFLPEYQCLGIAPSALEAHRPTTWMRDNFGIYYRVGCRLNANNSWWDFLCFQFLSNRGEATPEEIDYANMFIPHFAKAVELGRTFAVLKARFKALLGALDHYLIGTFITSENGTLLLENAEADRILERNDGLVKDSKGHLGLSGDNNAELLSLIAKVSATASGEGMDAEQIMTVTRRSGLRPYVLSICPLRDPEHSLESNFRGAIIYVIDPSNISIISTEGMAKLYGLTPAEDDVCSLLVKGLTTQEIADTRSVTIETVRSQIKALMKKTRVKSRIQLIKLALSVNLPIDQRSDIPEEL